MSTSPSLDIENNKYGELVVDSRLVAAALNIEHRSIKETIRRHIDKLNRLSPVPLEPDTGSRNPDGSGGETFYFLNENVSTFLMSLSHNTEQVVDAKFQLVANFAQAKALLTGINVNKPILNSFEDTVSKVNCLISILLTTGVEKGLSTQIALNTIKLQHPSEALLLNGMAKAAGLSQASATSYHSPTELALLIKEKYPASNITARKVNTILLSMGWQKKLKNEYSLTELGAQYGAAIPFGIPNSKRGGFHLRWKTGAAQLIYDYNNA